MHPRHMQSATCNPLHAQCLAVPAHVVVPCGVQKADLLTRHMHLTQQFREVVVLWTVTMLQLPGVSEVAYDSSDLDVCSSSKQSMMGIRLLDARSLLVHSSQCMCEPKMMTSSLFKPRQRLLSVAECQRTAPKKLQTLFSSAKLSTLASGPLPDRPLTSSKPTSTKKGMLLFWPN